MTRPEFMQALRNVKGWQLWDSDEMIRQIMPVPDGLSDHRCSDFLTCPITAVVDHIYGGVKPGDHTPAADWLIFAAELGLSKDLAWDIANASDNRPGHDQELRQELMLACGLA